MGNKRKILGEDIFEFDQLIAEYADSYIQNDKQKKLRLIKEIEKHLESCSSADISKRYHRLVGTLIPNNELNKVAEIAVTSLFSSREDTSKTNEKELDMDLDTNVQPKA